MSLVVLYLQMMSIITATVLFAMYTVVGAEQLSSFAAEYRSRLKDGIPHLCLLTAVLALSRFWRPVGRELSWVFGFDITHTLYSLEGHLVAQTQTIATTELTWFFSLVYVFGYGFLLLFPLVAYLFLDDMRPLRVTVLAYVFNYVGGLLCYTVFVSYGPRNYMPGEVQSLMYTIWPQVELLTTDINANTNVFPSLHTSVAITVALLAWTTRDSYPRWLYVSVPLAVSISFSTVYLGLHWLTDVVAGIVLAIASVVLASRLAAQNTEDSLITKTGRRLFRRTRLSVSRLRG